MWVFSKNAVRCGVLCCTNRWQSIQGPGAGMCVPPGGDAELTNRRDYLVIVSVAFRAPVAACQSRASRAAVVTRQVWDRCNVLDFSVRGDDQFAVHAGVTQKVTALECCCMLRDEPSLAQWKLITVGLPSRILITSPGRGNPVQRHRRVFGLLGVCRRGAGGALSPSGSARQGDHTKR